MTFCTDVLLERLHIHTRDPPYCPHGAAHCFQPCNEDGLDIEGCSHVTMSLACFLNVNVRSDSSKLCGDMTGQSVAAWL